MTAFVLFVYLNTASLDGGTAITSANFYTQKTCDDAAEVARHSFSSIGVSVKAICVKQ